MIELQDATDFINNFEKIYSKKVICIPYTTKEGTRKTILMCKCGKTYISLPYMSLGVLENRITDRKTAKFLLFETEEGSIISPNNIKFEIRDTLAHTHNVYADKLFLWINIAEKSDLLELFSSNVRRKVHKSIKDGVIVKYGTDKKLLKDFYYVYTHRMNEINIPPSSKKPIKNAAQIGVTTLFVAYLDGKVVGGATLNKITDDVYANSLFATLHSYNKHYVSYGLHFAMMNFARSSGAIYYSFGRSTRLSSVHIYKKQWGGEEIPLYWSYSHKQKNIRNNKLAYSLWKKLPFFIAKRLGPIISKYVY